MGYAVDRLLYKCSLRAGFLGIYGLSIATNKVVKWYITGFSFQHCKFVFVLSFSMCEQVVKCFDLAEKNISLYMSKT